MKFKFEKLGGGEYRAINKDNHQEHMIRWFIRRDLPEVVDIEELSYEDGCWSEDDFRSTLIRRSCVGMVSEKDKRVTGYIVYELYKRKLNILNLAVNPDDRRNAFATSLIEFLKFKNRKQKRKEINMDIRETNLPAQLFCRSQDFRAVNVLRGWYEDTGEDAYEMQCRLDKPQSLYVPANRISKYFA